MLHAWMMHSEGSCSAALPKLSRQQHRPQQAVADSVQRGRAGASDYRDAELPGESPAAHLAMLVSELRQQAHLWSAAG
jgi:hypothetical protein